MDGIKLIPYGMTNFESIIRDNYYYVDKTRYLAEMERTARFFFFVRPRRFGKTLFLNMMELYYDVLRKDAFEELFGGLYVGRHPTEYRNQYFVLKLNFSGVSANPDTMEAMFNEYCASVIRAFIVKYACFLPDTLKDEVEAASDASGKLGTLCRNMALLGLKMYLILDEYDNFANNVLASYGSAEYTRLTHGDGFLREFLKTVKDHTDRVIERMYITGVSPVTMDDLTSGFNIADNYSTDRRFNGMIGFSEAEVRQLLGYYESQGRLRHSIDDLLEVIRPWYDNYCFSRAALQDPSMYNSDMVLYFVNRYLGGQYPLENMIDSNCRTDYNKLRHLIQVDRKFGVNASVIQEIINTGGTFGVINTAFSVRDMVKTDNFKSLLFYYGMLSVQGSRGPMARLAIPNHVVQEQLYGYLADALRGAGQVDLNVDELNQLMFALAYEGDWQPYFTYIARQLAEQSAIREFMEGEAHVKGFILAYMGMNRYYMVLPEYEMNKGYSDFYMRPNFAQLPDIPFSYVVEVKYCERASKEDVMDKLVEEARKQLDRYAQCAKVQSTMGNTRLIKLAVVFRGWELARFVAV